MLVFSCQFLNLVKHRLLIRVWLATVVDQKAVDVIEEIRPDFLSN
jgi:hypothetical protein